MSIKSKASYLQLSEEATRGVLNPIWHKKGGWLFGPSYQSYRIKFFLIGLACWALCYFHKIYFYTLRSNLDKFFSEDYEIWLFVEDRYNISRISDTYKKLFICILLKYRCIPQNKNLLLILDFLLDLSWRVHDVIITFMTCLHNLIAFIWTK